MLSPGQKKPIAKHTRANTAQKLPNANRTNKPKRNKHQIRESQQNYGLMWQVNLSQPISKQRIHVKPTYIRDTAASPTEPISNHSSQAAPRPLWQSQNNQCQAENLSITMLASQYQGSQSDLGRQHTPTHTYHFPKEGLRKQERIGLGHPSSLSAVCTIAGLEEP